MAGRTAEELREELVRLMKEQTESFEKQTFVALQKEELRVQEDRFKRIREVAADYLAVLKKDAA